MVIVAGHITVDPGEREAFIASFVRVVQKARATAGCLDFAAGADPIDPGRVNLYERWESEEALEAFRRRAPRIKRAATILSASVAEHDVAGLRPLFGRG